MGVLTRIILVISFCAVDIRVYVMLVAGWAESGFWGPYLCVHGVYCVGLCLWASQ